MNMYAQLPRPTVFAHRGSSYHAPENTLAAFRLAVRQHADAIELDAKLSADGHVVVIHDQTVDRTTNGSGKVGDLDLAVLKTLDAGSHFDIAFQNEHIPTLEDVFQEVGNEIFINIELTNYASLNDSLPEKVAALVQRHGLTERVLVSSFNLLALRRFKRALPEVPLGLLTLPGRKGAWARSWIGRLLLSYQALHPDATDVSRRLVERSHRRLSRVHPYTVNDPGQMRELFDLGVDGIFTDDPILARQILEAQTHDPG